MKRLVLAMTLVFLSGCSDDVAREQLQDMTELQRNTQDNLVTCQQQLEFYRNQDTSGIGQPLLITSEKEAEPEYEEVDVYYVDGTKCYKTETSSEAPSCGRGFWECADGKIRECMTNVKYEIKTENKLVEE